MWIYIWSWKFGIGCCKAYLIISAKSISLYSLRQGMALGSLSGMHVKAVHGRC